MLTLLTLTVTVRVTLTLLNLLAVLTLPTLLTLILDTVVNKAPTSAGQPRSLAHSAKMPIVTKFNSQTMTLFN